MIAAVVITAIAKPFVATALATTWLYACGAFRAWVKRGAMEGRL